jgi:hypothetical protein
VRHSLFPNVSEASIGKTRISGPALPLEAEKGDLLVILLLIKLRLGPPRLEAQWVILWGQVWPIAKVASLLLIAESSISEDM